MATKQELIGQATDEQIAAWKTDRANETGVYAVIQAGRIAYFREPDIQDMNAGMAGVERDNPFDFPVNVARETFLGGCRELLEDRKYQRKLAQAIKPILDDSKSELVNF